MWRAAAFSGEEDGREVVAGMVQVGCALVEARNKMEMVTVVQWLLVRRRQWCDGDAVVAGEVRRCGGGCHGGGRRKEN